MTLLVCVATLSEEFTFAFLIPVLLACVYRLTSERQLCIQTGSDPARRRSDLCDLEPDRARPPVDDRSRAGAVGVRRGTFDAASALGMTLSEERRFVNSFGVGNVEFSIGMWCVLFLTICAALRYLIRTQRRWYWASAVYCAVIACAVSQLGIDFRRWWLLALTAQLATAALLWPAQTRSGTERFAPGPVGAARMGRSGTGGMRRLPVESGRLSPRHACSQRLLEKHRGVLGAPATMT